VREVGEELVTRGGYCGLLEEGRPGTGACRGGNLDIVIGLWPSIYLLDEFDIVAMDSICRFDCVVGI
jgi:hypothetical protein